MYKGKYAYFIIIFVGLMCTTLLPNLTNKIQASESESCILDMDSGFWHIIDQYVNNRSFAAKYYTKEDCHQAALASYGCIPAIEGQQFIARGSTLGTITNINYLTDRITDDFRNKCIVSPDTEDMEECRNTNNRYFTCVCSEDTTWMPVWGNVKKWKDLDGKVYSCGLDEFTFADLRILGVANAFNPLPLVSEISRLILAVGVFLFIINFLQGAILYVRSSGEEAGLKQARHKVTASLIGFIFMFLITGVIMYTYGVLQN
ncbi:hypothetical protein EBU94_00710 [bacterium]|nr:hypothetical protein [bacterium]NBO36043.1 hypothetical protein [bacterium]